MRNHHDFVQKRSRPTLIASRKPTIWTPDRASALPGRQSSDLPSPTDWLAIASNNPLITLQDRLIGLTDRDRDTTRQRRHARPACRLCMAQRGVYEPVYCWFPDSSPSAAGTPMGRSRNPDSR